MTTPLGPRGPKDPLPGRVVPFPRRAGTDGPAATPTTSTTTAKAAEGPKVTTTTPAPLTSTFEGGGGSAQAVWAPVEGAGRSQLLARLQAQGPEGRRRIKTAEAPRIVDDAGGRVHDGPVSIESRAGLAKLDGVTRVAGSLTLQEAALKSADLLSLRELQVVEGRLTFEGLRSV